MNSFKITIDPALFTCPVQVTLTGDHLNITKAEGPIATDKPVVKLPQVPEEGGALTDAEFGRQRVLACLKRGDLTYPELVEALYMEIPEPQLRALLATMKGRCQKVRRDDRDVWTVNP